jgi:hypothetical protein
MKEKTFCTILNNEIRISRKGWDHLVSGSKSKRRKIKDKHLRLSLLKEAKYIIKNPKKMFVSKKNSTNYILLEGDVTYGKSKGKIKVLLKQDKQKNYYFYSVMKT